MADMQIYDHKILFLLQNMKMILIFYTFHPENMAALESFVLTLSQWGEIFR